MVKIAVTGKGGVGKTTFASLLCYSFRDAGFRVVAVDADPDANLAATLGFPNPEDITPISEMKELIAERTGTQPGAMGMYFKMNPRVDDIPERFGTTHAGIRLLVMGAKKQTRTGCYCPESAFVRELIGHLLLEEGEVVIMDMEAGIEHIGRGTAGDVDAFIIVVEPGKRSIETAERLKRMAKDLGIKRSFIVINRAQGENDRAFVERYVNPADIIGVIPFSQSILESDRGDRGVQIEEMSLIDTIREKIMKGVLYERRE
ncbi:ArsA-related P-loop ATPase [Candidatus Latescibacterota bacterium]